MLKLSYKAKKLKQKLIEEYSISDSGGLAILQTGLEAYDRAEAARASIEQYGMLVPDRFKIPKPHPLLTVERDARSQWLQALKQLNLDIEPLNQGPGRPAGR